MTAVLVPQKHDEARLPLQATIAKLEEELHAASAAPGSGSSASAAAAACDD